MVRIMEFENRLEKWDSLFEELKDVLDSTLPELEKMMRECADRISTLENRISSAEDRIEVLNEKIEKASQNNQNLESILKSEIENQIELLERKLSERMTKLEEDVQRGSGDVETVFEGEDTGALKNAMVEFSREIEEIKKFMEKLSSEIEQIRGQMVEKHRILRERKVEGRSPRIL